MVKNQRKTVAQKVMVGKKSDNSTHKRKLIPSIALACIFAIVAVTGITYVAFNLFAISNCATTNSGTELCIESFTPDGGSLDGGNWITINGTGFPKNRTSDYVSNGLVAHWDGINNLGTGDQNHSNDSSTWTDLSASRVILTRTDGKAGAWTDFGYKSGASYTAPAFGLNGAAFPSSFPIGNANRTVEVVYKTPDNWSLARGGTQRHIFGYGGNTGSSGKFFSVIYRGDYENCTADEERFYLLGGYGVNIATCANETNGLMSQNKLHTITTAYTTKLTNVNTISYLNGEVVTNTNRDDSALATTAGPVSLLDGGRGLELSSVRLYNRVLSAAEIKQNADVDQSRFIAPPSVTIGDEPCTSLYAISDTVIRCLVPSNSSATQQDVKLSYKDATVQAEERYSYRELGVISVSPNTGNVQAGNTIVINGENFQYAPTDGYAKEGLVAHYDGIDNIGLGDMHHDNNSNVWMDLLSNNSLPRTDAGAGSWTSTGYKSGASYSGAAFNVTSVPANFSTGNADRTVEVVFRTPTGWALKSDDITSRSVFGYGELAGTKQFDVLYRGSTVGGRCASAEGFYLLGSNGKNLLACARTTNSLGQSNKINSVTTAYTTSLTNSDTQSYLNGALVFPKLAVGADGVTLTGNQPINTGTSYLNILNGARGLEALSIRLYDRVLTEEEIARNSDLDQLRFLSPPVVKIGNNTCDNVVVLSTSKLQCTVPKVASPTTENITVYDSTDTELANPKTLSAAYTYVNEQSMSITTIDPKVGPSFGGSKIRLTGKNLDINKVTVAGKECTDPVLENGNTTYTCTVPSIDITQDTFVDVVVIPNSGNNYVFAQGFQYIFARKSPVEFNVE
jgi:hypothetical protein